MSTRQARVSRIPVQNLTLWPKASATQGSLLTCDQLQVAVVRALNLSLEAGVRRARIPYIYSTNSTWIRTLDRLLRPHPNSSRLVKLENYLQENGVWLYLTSDFPTLRIAVKHRPRFAGDKQRLIPGCRETKAPYIRTSNFRRRTDSSHYRTGQVDRTHRTTSCRQVHTKHDGNGRVKEDGGSGTAHDRITLLHLVSNSC
jgi:hypothetical protein